MKSIEILTNETIKKSLQHSNRQYLVGELALPQELSHIQDKNVEIGITSYSQETIEKPHYHTQTNEYMYMLAGETKYLDLTNNIEFHLKKGDFFIIRKNTIYAQKSKENTTILFFKYPPGNDKRSVSLDDELTAWYASWQ